MAGEDFSTGVMLEAQVDPGSLRDSRQEIESSLSDTLTIDVEPSVGGAGSPGGMAADIGKPQRKGNRLAQENLELDVERNVLLEELVENAEDDALDGKRVGGGGIGMGLILGALTSGVVGALRNFEWPEIELPEFPDLDVSPPPFDVPIPVGAPEIKIPEIPTLEVPTIDPLKVPTIPPLDVPTIPPLDIPTIPPLHVPEIPELDVPEIPDVEYDGPTEIPVTFPTTFPDVPGSVVAGGAAGVAAGGAAYGLSKGAGGGVVNVGARGGGAGIGGGSLGVGIPPLPPMFHASDEGPIKEWIQKQLGTGGGSQSMMRGRSPTGTVTGSQNAARENRQLQTKVDVTNHVQVDATDDRQVKKTVDDELSKFEQNLKRKIQGKRGGLR